MATSILDYIFRELAVSYLGRNDLAHVEPADLMPDTTGKGDEEGKLETDDDPMPVVKRLTSNGYVRNRFTVLKGGRNGGNGKASVTGKASGGAQAATAHAHPSDALGADIDARAHARDNCEEAYMLAAAEPGQSSQLETGLIQATSVRLDHSQEARMKGYEGDACDECGHFTLVRNGTCLKCVTCGGTTGCS
jgi:ribonucleoside-diphosphate reductase alpha chain